jgi:uncharacterized protein
VRSPELEAWPAPVIDVLELARSGRYVEGVVPIGNMNRLRSALREDAGAIGYRFDGFTDALGRPAARLSLHGELQLTCDRCGQPVIVPLDQSSTFYFVRNEADLAALPVDVDDDAEPLLGSEHFDLTSLLEDEAILAVPLSPRHDTCRAERPDPAIPADGETTRPFAVLQGLLHKKGQ